MRRRPRNRVEAIKTAPPRATATLGPAPNPPVFADSLPDAVGASLDSSGLGLRAVGTWTEPDDGVGSSETPSEANGADVLAV